MGLQLSLEHIDSSILEACERRFIGLVSNLLEGDYADYVLIGSVQGDGFVGYLHNYRLGSRVELPQPVSLNCRTLIDTQLIRGIEIEGLNGYFTVSKGKKRVRLHYQLSDGSRSCAERYEDEDEGLGMPR